MRRSAAGLLLLLLACQTAGSVRPLRLSEIRSHGDATRAASNRLVARGLDLEASGAGAAVSEYERAIQVDPGNPCAFLALARHDARRDPDQALDHLDQAQLLFDGEPELRRRVEPHLIGLRGEALAARGETARGRELLQRAARLAPEVWRDGHLSPEELK